MGMSPDASIGYGIDLGGEDDGYHESLKPITEETGESLASLLYDLDEVFGWNEAYPALPNHLSKVPYPERKDHPEFIAFWAHGDAYRERYHKAIPVESHYYGHIEYSGLVLTTRRSYQQVDWGCAQIGMQQMFVPFDYETAALNKVLDYLGYTGERDFRWLLWASYG
jgi:hypothetical protein